MLKNSIYCFFSFSLLLSATAMQKTSDIKNLQEEDSIKIQHQNHQKKSTIKKFISRLWNGGKDDNYAFEMVILKGSTEEFKEDQGEGYKEYFSNSNSFDKNHNNITFEPTELIENKNCPNNNKTENMPQDKDPNMENFSQAVLAFTLGNKKKSIEKDSKIIEECIKIHGEVTEELPKIDLKSVEEFQAMDLKTTKELPQMNLGAIEELPKVDLHYDSYVMRKISDNILPIDVENTPSASPMNHKKKVLQLLKIPGKSQIPNPKHNPKKFPQEPLEVFPKITNNLSKIKLSPSLSQKNLDQGIKIKKDIIADNSFSAESDAPSVSDCSSPGKTIENPGESSRTTQKKQDLFGGLGSPLFSPRAQKKLIKKSKSNKNFGNQGFKNIYPSKDHYKQFLKKKENNHKEYNQHLHRFPKKFQCSLTCFEAQEYEVIKKAFNNKIYSINHINDINFFAINESPKRLYITFKDNLIYVTDIQYFSNKGGLDRLDVITCNSDSDDNLIDIKPREKPFCILKFHNGSLLQNILAFLATRGHIIVESKESMHLGYQYFRFLNKKQYLFDQLIEAASVVLDKWYNNSKNFSSEILHFFYFGILNKNYYTSHGKQYKKKFYHLEEKQYFNICCLRQFLKDKTFREVFYNPKKSVLSLLADEFGDNSKLYIEFQKLTKKKKSFFSKSFEECSITDGALCNIILKYILDNNILINTFYSTIIEKEKMFKYFFAQNKNNKIIGDEYTTGSEGRNLAEAREEKKLLEFFDSDEESLDYAEYTRRKKAATIEARKFNDSIILKKERISKSPDEYKEEHEIAHYIF